jgi:isopenicillin-N N-acyltransferase-like protein
MSEYSTLWLHGDAYTMGRQHGQQVRTLRPQIAAAMDARFRQLEADGPDARFERLVHQTRLVLEEVDTPLLAMIRGQAEALAFEFETLLRYNLIAFLRDDLLVRRAADVEGRTTWAEGCTTWAASGPATASGAPILAKNRDYRPDHLPLQNVVHATPDRGYAYLYVSSAGSPGVFSAGMNQAGLAVADTHVYSRDLGPGLPSYALMMHILEGHDGVSSALDYLRAVPRLGRNNLILADATGHLAVFEGGHSRHGLFERQGGALVNTNHFASEAMRDCFAAVDPPQARGRSLGRYELVTRALAGARGRIDVAFARALAATHDGPLGSVCCHPQANTKATTISASIFLPEERQMLFCQGLPCQGRFDLFAV